MSEPFVHSTERPPTLEDVSRRLAPQLSVVSSSQPVPSLRTHNVLALADSPEHGRRAVLALESLEYDDDKLGTVVMGRDDGNQLPSPDAEGIGRQVLPRVVIGALIGAVVGVVVIGGAAVLFGGTTAQVLGAAFGGLLLFSVFGAIWVTFAGLGGSDAYRQTFVADEVSDLTIVSLHTDDPDEAAAARDALRGGEHLRIVDLDRSGRVARRS